MYRGVCVSGPMDGRVVSSPEPKLHAAVENELQSAAGSNVVSLISARRQFTYLHLCGISVNGRDDTFDFWVPEEWIRRGKEYAASVAIQMIYDAYVDPDR
jgi:hypothetical protein